MNWFRSKIRGNTSPHPEQRQALLACASLHEVGDLIPDDPDTPQSRFHAALASLTVGDRDRARAHLQELLHMDESGAQLRLQAWSCLRELGIGPPAASADQVRGVVVDIGHAAATETIAAYVDLTATCLRPDGEVLHWSEPDCGIDDVLEAMLTRAAAVMHGGPPTGPCEQLPAEGHALISVLTFGGIHARIGSLDHLRADPAGSAVLELTERLAEAIAERRAAAPGSA